MSLLRRPLEPEVVSMSLIPANHGPNCNHTALAWHLTTRSNCPAFLPGRWLNHIVVVGCVVFRRDERRPH